MHTISLGNFCYNENIFGIERILERRLKLPDDVVTPHHKWIFRLWGDAVKIKCLSQPDGIGCISKIFKLIT